MSNFLIQTDNNNEILHDFSFHLVQAIKYQNWYYNEEVHDYYLTEDMLEYDFTDYIPVGSVEFVLDYYQQYHEIDNIKPINIPKKLMKPEYLKRLVMIGESDKSTLNAGDTPLFVKDNTKIKGITDIIQPNCSYPPGEYLLSEVVDIVSEWRGFVYNDKLLDLRCYSGDFWRYPDFDTVAKMIYDYKDSPAAYTIDVGVNSNGTFIIECHQFFSCGLYGFADYKVLPQMFVSCHKEIVSSKN